ncbi:MAG TPA: GNAT family N-acetyltransferase [Pseudonocardiaceae bacterium]|jgi:ribosomal protein S18 acetylase RimI-like enzyme|nr:GNAT family N-acetyltransferase [Pseudonocardiaceae bacterium]
MLLTGKVDDTMTNPKPRIGLRHYAGHEFSAIRNITIDLYREAFEHEIDEPFWSVEKYSQRIERHAAMSGFSAVIAYTDEPVGFAYGIALPPTTRWWATIQPPLTDPTFTREDGHRTFALFEVIVKPHHQGHGIGRRIHDDLLAQRIEQRVTIATNHDNIRARNTYLKWGYHHIGTRQPAPPAPLLDVFLRAG